MQQSANDQPWHAHPAPAVAFCWFQYTCAPFRSPRADAPNTKGPTMLLWLVVAYLVVSIGIGLYAATWAQCA